MIKKTHYTNEKKQKQCLYTVYLHQQSSDRLKPSQSTPENDLSLCYSD